MKIPSGGVHVPIRCTGNAADVGARGDALGTGGARLTAIERVLEVKGRWVEGVIERLCGGREARV